MNLFLAIFLFSLTTAAGYVVWYVIRGQRDREMRKRRGLKPDDEAQEPSKKAKKKLKWGLEKDAYCYPDINDVMGYEFVSVIKVPGELTKNQKAATKQEEKRPTWETARGIGGLMTVSYSDRQDKGNPDLPDHTGPTISRMTAPEPGPQENTDVETPGEKIIVVQNDIFEEDIDRLMNGVPADFDEWPAEDSAQYSSEEQINAILESNKGSIDESLDPDTMKTAEELEYVKNIKELYVSSNENEQALQELEKSITFD